MLLQISLTFIATLTVVEGTPPPGYNPKPQDPDPNPPKYEYGYNIADDKGTTQGKMEVRDGIYAQGRYYVQGSSSSQSVEYLADDWGYHPVVEYSNVGPHSRTVTQIALGSEAVQALQKSNKDISAKLPISSTKIASTQGNVKNDQSKPGIVPNNVAFSINQQNYLQPQSQSASLVPSNKPGNIIQENGQVSETPTLILNTINQESPQTLQSQVFQDQANYLSGSVQNSIENSSQKSLLEQQEFVDNSGEINRGSDKQNLVTETVSNIQDQDKIIGNSIGQSSLLDRDQRILAQPLQAANKVILLDQAQSIQNGESLVNSHNANKDFVLLNQPQQIYLQPITQQLNGQTSAGLNLNEAGGKGIAQNQQILLRNEHLTNINEKDVQQSHQNTLFNSQAGSQSFSLSQTEGLQEVIGGNTLLTQQKVPLIFLTQEQLNKGILLLSPTLQTGYNLENNNQQLDQVHTQFHTQQVSQITIDQNDANANLQALNEQSVTAPIALPLTYHNVPKEQTDNFHIQNIQNHLGSKQSTNVLKDILTAQNVQNYLQNNEKQRLDTAALFESGSDVLNVNSQEESARDRYAGSYGEKISVKLTNKAQNVKAKPSKLIESTKNLVSGLDVLSINDAAENVAITPLSLIGRQQSISISEASSQKNFENANIISTTPISIIHEKTVTPFSLLNNPIIVPDYEGEDLKQNYEEVYSTTHNTVETVKSNLDVTDSTVLVTPRPIHSNFLAPITAGIQLQNAEQNQQKKFLVEVQESVPYYVGKFEYVQGYKTKKEQEFHDDVIKNLDLGKALIDFPVNQEIQKLASSFKTEGSSTSEAKNIVATNNIDQQEEQGQIQQISLSLGQVESRENYGDNLGYANQEETSELPHRIQYGGNAHDESVKIIQKIVPQPYTVEKIIEKPVHIPIEVTKYVDRPYAVHVPVAHPVPYPVEKVIEKYVNRPYPVHVPVHIPVQVPVTVEKKVPVPYPVEKIVEKPVTKIVEKPVPQPYPVEKIVEKQVPVEVTKYIDRPYPVKVPVPQPYPVEKIVEKQVPVEVNKYIDRPYPVNVPVAQPYPIEKIVNKVVAKPYAVPVIFQQPIPVVPTQTYLVPINIKHTQAKGQGSGETKYHHFFVSNPYSYAPSYQSVQKQIDQNSIATNAQDQKVQVVYEGITPLVQQTYKTIQQQQPYLEYGAPLTQSHLTNCKTLNKNEYIGLVPPKDPRNTINNALRKRQAKSSFESPRMEYGFLPPLVPSQEIDANGRPIESKDS